jgi:hypothetical protein
MKEDLLNSFNPFRIQPVIRLIPARLLLLMAAAAMVLMWSFGAADAAGHTLYVSNSGSDSNSCAKGDPCQTIGHAVSVAGAHAEIIVESGTYPEMVTITSPLSLVGQDATIDASEQDNGFLIQGASAAGTEIDGFTVENATFEGILARETSHLTIAHNVVRNNDQGAGASPLVGECAAAGPIPGDCGEALHLWAVSHSKLINNDVHDNVGGILLTDETGPTHDNLVMANHVTNNAADCGITLPSHNPLAMTDPSAAGVYDNVIIGNISRGNGGAGVGMFAPFQGTASYNNKVIGNTLENNGEGGANIHSHAPNQNVSGNLIVGNSIGGNGVDHDSGSTRPNGISLFSAVDPQQETIAGNQIHDEYYGIFIAGPITVHGLKGNHFDSSVTVPVQH